MGKKSYPLENETLSIVTPLSETYTGQEIPTVITTTVGVNMQSGQSIKICSSKGNTKTKKP